jgi:hypothetical protein
MEFPKNAKTSFTRWTEVMNKYNHKSRTPSPPKSHNHLPTWSKLFISRGIYLPFTLPQDSAIAKNNLFDGFMGLNATFNNNSAISWRSVLLVEETGVSGENL